jgi:hypothetical protein
MGEEELELSAELVQFFNGVVETFEENKDILTRKVSDKDRKKVLDGLGRAGSDFRTGIYDLGFSSEKSTLSKRDLLQFLGITLQFLDHSIESNKRPDNLYHAYNLVTIENESEVSISYLPEMLEGQVAVLSSGYINGEASLELLDALKSSALFRPDQYSYILYPNKELPRFDVKNNIPEDKVSMSSLFTKLVKDGDRSIIEEDVEGNYHFNGRFNNADSLKKALSELPDNYESLVSTESQLVLDVFEDIFDHKSFTGRSGTFFGYEGLGSIYWHMVSKLVLGIQETCLNALKNGVDKVTVGRLLDHYYEAYEGIGVHKSPELYGAFPTDPYSHTPAGKGAQQPGMTGQVKEDVLSRFGELGVVVSDGQLSFDPHLLRKDEFLKRPATFTYVDVNREVKELQLQVGELGFTYCQVPIIYKLDDGEGLKIINQDESFSESSEMRLDRKTSSKIFERTGEISQIVVSIKK